MDESFTDLRSWLRRVEDIGELRVIEGVHWRHELGGVMDLIRERPPVPALLFDSIVDYPRGYRVLSNPLHSPSRMGLALGLPAGLSQREYAKLWMERRRNVRPLPSRDVTDGPVLENVQHGDDVNLLKFPVPLWRELDGGRYIGTADLVVTRDPDDGWINVGTYRVMVVDERHVTVYMDPGRDGRLHQDKDFARGQPSSVVISVGQHPLLFLCACTPFLSGKQHADEFEIAGGIRGEPVELISGEVTGLPFPAYSEIVIEAVARPGERHPEGPFAEYTGYYGGSTREEPLYEVQRIYHRSEPIILGDPPGAPQRQAGRSFGFFLGTQTWDELDAMGVPNVVGIAKHAIGGGNFVVVSIKQAFPGHAKQAGAVVAMSKSSGAGGRYVVVVDDDIDPTDLNSVIWAIANRSDPQRDIDILRNCWGSPLDPIISPDDKERGSLYQSRAIIDACKPYEWKDKFPPANEMTAQLRQDLLDKWGWAVRGEARPEEQASELAAPIAQPIRR